MSGWTIHTDEFPSYNRLWVPGYEHKKVEHGTREFVRDGSHVNTLEAVLADPETVDQEARVPVSEKRMPKYLAEFSYRTEPAEGTAPDVFAGCWLSPARHSVHQSIEPPVPSDAGLGSDAPRGLRELVALLGVFQVHVSLPILLR